MVMVCIQFQDINLKFGYLIIQSLHYMRKDQRVHGYFLTRKGAREQICLENTAIYHVYHVNKCWTKDGAVSTVARLRDGRYGVQIAAGTRALCLLQNVKTGSPSYSMGSFHESNTFGT